MQKIAKNLRFLSRETERAMHRISLRKAEFIILLILLFEFMFPQISLGAEITDDYLLNSILIETRISSVSADLELALESNFANSFPVAQNRQPKQTIWVTITAYSSTVDQTDSTPCITANGFDLCENNKENVVAANFLTFNTEVKMPELFGDRIFTVQDRMNKRYSYRMDIWMKTREAAREFGVKTVKVEVF